MTGGEAAVRMLEAHGVDHGLHRSRIGNAKNDDVARPCHLGGTADKDGAGRDDVLQPGGVPSPDGDLEACLQQAHHHRPTHQADADVADPVLNFRHGPLDRCCPASLRHRDVCARSSADFAAR